MKRSFAYLALAGAVGVGATIVACGESTTGGGGGGGSSEVTTAHGDFHGYAVNKITLPMANKDYAIDLNGDGRLDNQLGNIIGTLAANNLDAQSGVDLSIQEGSVSVLFDVQTNDATLKSDATVGVTAYLGKNMGGMIAKDDGGNSVDGGSCKNCPDFSGMGMFTVDASQSPVTVFGVLAGGNFKSNNPVTTKKPVSVTLKIALISGAAPLNLTLNGAHVQWTSGMDVATKKPGLLNGQIHGSIKSADIQTGIIPAVAQLLTMRLKADPTSASSKQIAGIFDTGGCGTAKPNDGIIDTCEVANNSIIMAVLAPDIQVYDANGNYAPNKDNKVKDSLSAGLSFTAVAGTIVGK